MGKSGTHVNQPMCRGRGGAEISALHSWTVPWAGTALWAGTAPWAGTVPLAWLVPALPLLLSGFPFCSSAHCNVVECPAHRENPQKTMSGSPKINTTFFREQFQGVLLKVPPEPAARLDPGTCVASNLAADPLLASFSPSLH